MDPDIAQLLADFPVCFTLPIQWGEQDAMRHVNNAVYFRWFESARDQYGIEVGWDRMLAERRIGPILASVTCNFRRQLTFPDTVHIGARITRLGRSSMIMKHCVVSEALRAIAADGDSIVVTFDYAAQKSIPVPVELRSVIEQIEGRNFE